MGKGKLYLVIAIIIVVFIGGVGLLSLNTGPMIHGYDGPVATISSIDDRYAEDPLLTRRFISGPAAYVYPIAPDIVDIGTMCGVRIEIMAAPNVITTDYIDTITEVVVDDEAQTNYTKNWDVQRVTCSMSATVQTYEGGVAKCGETTFWIRLEKNAYSIFSNADESYAFFVNVYTRDTAQVTGEMEVVPTAGGWDFELTPVDTEPVPQWLTESGYTGNVNNFDVVEFPITVLNAQPTVFAELIRTGEASATFDIGIDVTLVGYWEEVKTYRDWEWPEPEDQTWLIVVIILAIVGVAGTVLIVVRLGGRFHPVLLFIFVAACWIPLILWVSMDLVGKLQEFLGG